MLGEISLCPDCGVVHVALQYMVLRFDRVAFESLAKLMGDAQQKAIQLLDAQAVEADTRVSKAAEYQVKSSLH